MLIMILPTPWLKSDEMVFLKSFWFQVLLLRVATYFKHLINNTCLAKQAFGKVTKFAPKAKVVEQLQWRLSYLKNIN